MEIGTLLILLALLLSCAAILTRPFYATEPSLPEQDLELLILREASQAAQKQLTELQEEYAQKRMDADDFTVQQDHLQAHIQHLQHKISTIIETDPVEQAVADERARIQGLAAQPQLLQTCEHCGEPIDPAHRFCPSCGQPQSHGGQS
ncbi:MAG: zinc ribbon domain-containing protein [Anaerolineales bacterium]|nr:zinc ribbon domain-containing protein [Anaerolineales bacterium]